MADLTARIKPKKSSTTGEVPQAADLEVAELAVNTADGKLFVKHTDDSIKEISGGGGGSSTLEGLTDTYNVDTGERFYNEGTHPSGGQTETGNYSIYSYAPSNQGVTLYKTDANGDNILGMFPDNFVFQLGGTSGALRISSTSGSGYTDYTWNYITTSEGSASPTDPTWVKFNFDNRSLPATGQGDLYFTTTVSTASGVPADGQALTWVDANSKWEPVAQSIQNASDYKPLPGVFPYWATKTGDIDPPAGEWFANGTSVVRLDPVDSNGTDWSSEMTALGTTGTFWYSTDGTNWTQTTNSGGFDNLPTWFQFDVSPFDANAHTGGLYFSFSDPATAPGAPLQDGQFLAWTASESAFQPAATSIQGASDYKLQPATGTGSVTRTLQTSNSNGATSGGVGALIIGSGFTYWAYNPEGPAAANILTHLRDTAAFPIDVDINGTTVSVTGIQENSPNGGNGGSLRLDHPGLTSTGQITGTDWTLTLAAAPTTPIADGNILRWVASESAFQPQDIPVDSDTTTAGTGSNAISNIVTISQVDYDALGTPDANTIYFIV